jgi:DNA anti-recombination protein RmuC
MPLDDPEYCGRLRDHLCIAAESAETRLHALETEEANSRNQLGIQNALERLNTIIVDLQQANLRDKTNCDEVFIRMEQSLSKSFVHMGMTESQENYLADMISGFMKELMELLDSSEATFVSIQDLSDQLGQLMPELRNEC